MVLLHERAIEYQLQSVYVVGATAAVIACYQSSTIDFILQLYRSHRLAYYSHVKQIVVLFVVTEISLCILLVLHCHHAVTTFCQTTEMH